jgi:aryl-alcohol dehydrogenase-like predicted oxidoreductase
MEIKDLKKSGGTRRIGLGLAALGRPGYINLGHGEDLGEDKSVESLRARGHAVLDAAWEAGVRYFDAARSYGRAEEFLAGWLSERGIKPDETAVGSKWGYRYTADWQIEPQHHEIKEHSLAVLERQIGESRNLLGDHLKLYQIHSATRESGVLQNKAVLERLAELKDEGLLIGLSVSGPNQADASQEAVEISYDGERLFGSVQATWIYWNHLPGLH